MAKGKITKRDVLALRCKPEPDEAKRKKLKGSAGAFLWDDTLEGFGVAAFPSGKKVFVFQYRQHGRAHRLTIGRFGRLTVEQARSEAKKRLGEVETGIDPIKARRKERTVRTFGELSAEFQRVYIPASCKPRTGAEYERLLKLHILPVLGSRRLTDLKGGDVAKFHAGLTDHPQTANRCVSLISNIWNWGARRGECAKTDNPATGVERNQEQGKERFLSTEELGRLGDAMRRGESVGFRWTVDKTKPKAKHIPKAEILQKVDAHAVAAIRLLILTGARLREILGAKWSFVDWDRGIMFLPDSKTGRKPIYLSGAALAVLKDIPRVEGNPYIIPGWTKAEKPLPCPRSDLKRPWGAISKAAGFEDVRLHDLRHSFASIGAGASLGLPIIGKLLGHSQPATTARYSHLDADPIRKAADIIGNQISAAMSGKSAEVVQIETGRRSR